VAGTSSSGKTTLARALAEKLDYAHIELDALHWGRGGSRGRAFVTR
jgi:adenylate kinase family enzyme